MAESLRQFITPIKRIKPGIYHYISPPEDPRNYRLHLRLEPDGNGILILNAATILHLNQTAAEYAYYLIHNLPPDQVARKVAARYHVSREQAHQDYQNLADRIQTLINTPDLDPVTFLGFERQIPYSGQISAPYRLDCAITYRLPASEAPESAPTERAKTELTTSEWKDILDKAWSVGIPHIVFTGGEPTLRDDLMQLISYAEQNGQISGLLSEGLRLADKGYLDALLQTGLDHLMIVFQQDNELSWKALNNALVGDLFVAVHITITQATQSQIQPLLKRLAEMGVKAISLSANDPSLRSALQSTRDLLADLDLELVWNLPVPYSAQHPVAMETKEIYLIEASGRAWLYVEPDGDVLPAQGLTKVLGNFLRDPWEKIWSRH